MKHLTITKTMKDIGEVSSVDVMVARLLESADHDFKLAVISKCQIELLMEDDKVTLSTKYPISILKMPNGRVLSLIEIKK